MYGDSRSHSCSKCMARAITARNCHCVCKITDHLNKCIFLLLLCVWMRRKSFIPLLLSMNKWFCECRETNADTTIIVFVNAERQIVTLQLWIKNIYCDCWKINAVIVHVNAERWTSTQMLVCIEIFQCICWETIIQATAIMQLQCCECSHDCYDCACKCWEIHNTSLCIQTYYINAEK